MNVQKALQPDNIQISDLKFELRNLNYEKLLELAVGQKLLIEDYEEFFTKKWEDIELQKKLLETVEMYVRKSPTLDRDTLVQEIQELKAVL
jgi:hypothetical protein